MALAQQQYQQSRETVDTFNPATGELHKTYELLTQEEAETAVENSHDAFLRWRSSSLQERAEIVNRIADILDREKSSLAEMMAKQMGKPVEQGEQEAQLCAAICRYTAKEAFNQLQDEERELLDGGKGLITYQPIGVILGLQPWNFPLYQCIRYSIAVIMAGNTTVFKHATICFETAQRIEEIYEEAGLPKDVFNAINISSETADELIKHDKVRGVTYTGSAGVGAKIAKAAGEHLKKTVMELGGSDAYLVLEDADLDSVIESCVEGRVNNSGQTCIAAKRFLVVESIYDEFKNKFVNAMKAVTYGDPLDKDNDMGPLAQQDLREKLHEQVIKSVDAGANILCGGEIPKGKGYFYPATVLENIEPGSPAYDQELFGPVAALFKVADEEQAIEIANEHKYGLGGGVFSSNKERALRIAREELDTGMVNINQYGIAQPNMPFGGVKDSGYGREHGGFGLREFVNIKALFVS